MLYFRQMRLVAAEAVKSRGFTIVEVMVVLAVSMIIFAAGITTFKGLGNETGFDQSIQDATSELSTQIRGSASNAFFNDKGYNCKSAGSPTLRPTLNTEGGSAKNEDCVAIGRAIEVVKDSSTIYIYQVLGNRLNYTGGAPTGPASSLAETNPTPANLSGSDLSFSYRLTSDLTLVSAKAVINDTTTIDSYLGGF
jgi:prepilin-type N-terminal cleavage/methylation domain-containing protein